MCSDDPELDRRLGARLRDRRAAAGLTLDGLAERTGVSRAMLSRVERGESSPTAQLLVRICGGLRITPSVLFAEAPTSTLSRRAEQPVWRDPASGYRRRNVSPPGSGSAVDIVEVVFPPGGAVMLDSLPMAAWDQHVWVLDGTLDLRRGAETVRLEAGDCLMMRFDRPLGFSNPTARDTRYAVIVHRPASTP